MQLHIHIDSDSNARELLALSNFTRELSAYRSGGAITGPLTAPTDPAELNEPEIVVVGNATPTDPLAQAGSETPKRRRRTKAEIEAAAKAVDGTVAPDGPCYWSHPESDSFGVCDSREGLEAILSSDPNTVEVSEEQYRLLVISAENARVATLEAEAQASNEAALGNAQPAPTQTAPETTTGASQAPVAETPATASPSDAQQYAAADVQKLAVDAARRYGPEKVKALISEYGSATKIADLKQEDLAGFVVKLNALSAE